MLAARTEIDTRLRDHGSFTISQKYHVDMENKKLEPVDEQTKEVLNITWKIIHETTDREVIFSLDGSPNSEYSSKYEPWQIFASSEQIILKPFGKCYFKKEDVVLERNKPIRIQHETGQQRPRFEKLFFHNLGEYVNNDHIIVKFNVIITKYSDIHLKLRNFDNAIEGFSDVALAVGNATFYVSKAYLAFHSTYFKKLFEENRADVIRLDTHRLTQETFQYFLEIIHGELALNDSNVYWMLRLGKLFETPCVTRQSEQFLMNQSKKKLEERFKLALDFELENLKLECISEMKSLADVQSVISKHWKMDYETLLDLMGKLATVEK